ncbi:MAG: hypothetical protein DI537_17555 [Stutzerimonas stutzeri]|nr:MAG: hypothetical protein DI537_17555 [Stutzerimonas stutzeri]
MTNISAEAFRRGFTLRSGGAGGADLACEKDVPERGKEIFLPWKGFNGSTSRFYPAPLSDAAIAAAAARLAPDFDPSRILDFDGANADPADIAGRSLLIARHFHPAWDRCSQGAKKLHMRNVPQVLGQTLSSPARFVLCWTKDGGATGGTGQAIRIADAIGIPVLNLQRSLVRQSLLSFLGL